MYTATILSVSFGGLVYIDFWQIIINEFLMISVRFYLLGTYYLLWENIINSTSEETLNIYNTSNMLNSHHTCIYLYRKQTQSCIIRGIHIIPHVIVNSRVLIMQQWILIVYFV